MDFNDGHNMSVELKTLPAVGKAVRMGRRLVKWGAMLNLTMKLIELTEWLMNHPWLG